MAIYIHRAYYGDKMSDYFLRKARHQAQFAQLDKGLLDMARFDDELYEKLREGNFAFGLMVREHARMQYKLDRMYAYSKINTARDRAAWVRKYKIDEFKGAGKKLDEKTAAYTCLEAMRQRGSRAHCAEAKLIAYFGRKLHTYDLAGVEIDSLILYIYTTMSPCEDCRNRINDFHREMQGIRGKPLDIKIFYSIRYKGVEYPGWSTLQYGDSYNKAPKPRTPASGAPSAKTPPKPTDKTHFPALGKK